MTYTPSIISLGGYDMPANSDYTDIQSVCAAIS
jgi:hypothetical protein